MSLLFKIVVYGNEETVKDTAAVLTRQMGWWFSFGTSIGCSIGCNVALYTVIYRLGEMLNG